MTRRGIRRADDYRLLERDVKFEGRFVTVALEHLRMPHGVEVRHEVLRLPRAVAIVPLRSAGVEGGEGVVLVEQFRSALGGFIHEIPAGILEEGEDPAVCAGRELREETGYSAGSLQHLATLMPLPGTSAHVMDFYLAEELVAGDAEPEETECLEVREFALQSLLDAMLVPTDSESVVADVVVDAKTHLGLLHAAALLERRRRARTSSERSARDSGERGTQ